MTSDTLKLAVQEVLRWDDTRHIAVTTHDGAVTLSGYVPTYFDRMRAVTATEHVHGVKAVVDELEVRLQQPHHKEDSDIADAVVHVLEWNSALWNQDTKVAVSRGHVTLTGEVDWNYQRDEAERAVKNLEGVTAVTNRITVTPPVAASTVEQEVINALARHTAPDAGQIHVTMSGSKAVLSGYVHSLDEARIAKNAARSAPGVSAVDDHFLAIHP